VKTVPHHARFVTRLLLGLMLAMALLPGLSRAWAATQGGDWVEICSAQGSRWVQVDESDGDEPAFQPMAEHCAACQLQLQPLAPPPQALVWQPLPTLQAAPPLFLLAPRPLAIWASRLSRGPPALA
jgi:hypothetical protein